MNPDAPKLLLDHLTKVYGPRPLAALQAFEDGHGDADLVGRHTLALHDVSFDVHPGEIFIVMGLSGSGKSTLVRCVNRLIEPTRGHVLLDGADITAMSRPDLRELRRHKLGMVFQGFALLPHRTVLDNVAYGLEVQGVARPERVKRSQEALALVGLAEWGRSYPDELSGGMRQRVGLARALATDPDVLLMDEPFSALDPLIRRRMQDELLDIQDRLHKTILFITHDLDEALKLGNRIAIMKDGQVVQLGTPEDILLHPADDYVASFIEGVDRSKVLRARDVMIQPKVTVRVGHHPSVAVRVMEGEGLSSVFATGPGDRLAGLVTADGALAAAAQGGAEVRSILQSDLPTVGPETLLRDLIPLTAEVRYPIPVIDEAGRLLGIVPRVAVLRALAESSQAAIEAETVPEFAPAGDAAQ